MPQEQLLIGKDGLQITKIWCPWPGMCGYYNLYRVEGYENTFLDATKAWAKAKELQNVHESR